MDSAYYGFNMQVQNNKEFYVNNIVHNLGQLTKDRPSFNLDYKWYESIEIWVRKVELHISPPN